MLQVNYDAVEIGIVIEYVRLRQENELLVTWIRQDSDSPMCVVCGAPIDHVSLQRMLRPYLWCSRKCFEFKPRKIINLEKKYGADITEILAETTRNYGNIKAQCHALGISIPYFYAIVKKYCNAHSLEFLAINSAGKRKEAYLKKVVTRNQNLDKETVNGQ